jgi:hypothetical protein
LRGPAGLPDCSEFGLRQEKDVPQKTPVAQFAGKRLQPEEPAGSNRRPGLASVGDGSGEPSYGLWIDEDVTDVGRLSRAVRARERVHRSHEAAGIDSPASLAIRENGFSRGAQRGNMPAHDAVSDRMPQLWKFFNAPIAF